MSNFQYKNPLSPIQVLGVQSVSRTSTFGTNFSILGTGGYMEVYGLTDLNFVIPVGQTGFIEFSGNTIPIEFNKGTGTAFSPDVVTLNSDNMSSGRRRLGMLVYVYETNKIYRHTIENYGGLWSAATDASGVGGPTVVISDFGTTVKNNSVAGQNLINAWTGSTIEGVDGYTNLNATWRELVTGSGGTSTADTFVTGFTLSSNTITLTQNRTDQYSSFTISLSAYTGSSSTTGAYLPLSGGTVTGNTIFQSGLTANTLNVTGNTLLSGLTASTISATTYQNVNAVTGGTYSPSTGVVTLSGTGSVNGNQITGFTTSFPYLPLSGGTVTGNTIFQSGLTANTLTVTGNTLLSGGLTATTISATTYQNVNAVTGGSYSNGTITLSGTGNFASSISGFPTTFINDYLPLSGGTVTGNTIFQSGLTANTLNVTGNTLLSGLTAATISATTYLNYPDTFVTGFTLSSNTITLSQNRTDQYSAFTISLSAYTGTSISGLYLPLSGGTVTGNTIFNSGLTANTLTVTGDTLLSGLTATTISATTYQNVNAVTGGTYSNGTITLSGTGSVNGNQITGFSTGGGGGGGQIFYLNLSQSQNGNRLLSTTASTSSEQTSGVTIGNGVTGSIASFQTTPLNISLIPGGIWSFYLHSYKQNNNASFNIFVEVYKITSGGSQTLLFATDPAPVTTNSPNPSMQLTDGYFSGTALNVSDGVVAVVKATNTGNQSHSITLVTEGSAHYSYVVSTIPTQQGLTCDTLSGCSIIQTIQTDVSNKLDKSGGTVNGNTVFQSGLTATTISATTYENVNAVTGGTYNGTTGVITLSGTGSVNGNQITGFSTGGGGLTWQFAISPLTATTNNGYITTGTTSIALPTVAALGSTIEIVAASDNLFTITQNANQFIRFGIITTTQTSGTLVSQNNGDSIRLVCTSANTVFTVVSAVGTLTLN